MTHIAVATTLAMTLPVLADPATEAALLRALEGEAAPDTLYAQGFLDAIPVTQLSEIVEGLRAVTGPVLDVEVEGERFRAESATHVVKGRIALDGEGRIALFFIEPPAPKAASLDVATVAFEALGGSVSWLVRRDGEVLSAQRADEAMAVGSAFKLAVMAVLAQDITQATRDWADVVRLRERHLSLPTGRMRDLPVGAPVTLFTAAAAMIAESDNTATDLLLDVVGRERVARRLGLDHALSTREFFALKADASMRNRYLYASADSKAEIAARAAEAPLPSVAEVSGAYSPGLEWSVPLTTLCDLIEEVAHLPLMAINPGPVDPALWSQVAYKGGSETGVLNLTAAMRDDEDRLYCVALSVNDTDGVDAAAAVGALRTVEAVLAGRS